MKKLGIVLAVLLLSSTAQARDSNFAGAENITLHNCIPIRIQAYDPDPSARVEVLVDRWNHFTVAHHMENGLVHIRNEQYRMIDPGSWDSKRDSWNWMGQRINRPEIKMVGILKYWSNNSTWRYEEYIYNTSNRSQEFVSACEQTEEGD